MFRFQGCSKHRLRSGAAAVEFAIMFPVFVTVMFGLFEFGRAYMAVQMINLACRMGARSGITDNTTTAQVLESILGTLDGVGINRNKVRVFIMDATAFDENPNSPPNLSDMMKDYPNNKMEMATAKPRALAIIRVEVDYKDVALITPFWLDTVVLRGQVVVRHE